MAIYLDAGNIVSGLLNDARLTTNIPRLNTNNSFSGSLTVGSGLSVTSGTVSLPNNSISDSALSSNVPLKDVANTFAAMQTFSASVVLATGQLQSNSGFQFTTLLGAAQAVRAASFLASNAYSDSSKVPTNGIYSKGQIRVDGGILLDHSTSNLIDFQPVGVGAPAVSNRSVGTKVVLYGSISSSQTDYAVGVESSHIWMSVPSTGQGYKWYGGTSRAATLSGTGNFDVVGSVTVGNGMTVSAGDLNLTAGKIGLAPNTGGAVPTSYIGFGGNNSFYVDASNGSVLQSNADVAIHIDANNADTTRKFVVRANTNKTVGGIDLMTVSESGNLWLKGESVLEGLVRAGELVVFPTSGGASNGNIWFRQTTNDSYPTMTFRNGGTIRSQIFSNVTTGSMTLDAPGGLAVRDTVNGGTEWLKVTTEGRLVLSVGSLSSDNPFGFLTTGGTAQKVHAGGVLVSNSYSDTSLVPANGLYVKGGAKFNSAIELVNGTSNVIAFGTAGTGAPTFNTRSAGTKLVLFSALAASSGDHAIGVENGYTWYSAPTTAGGHKWYSGTTNTMTLAGSGNLAVIGSISTGTTAGTGVVINGTNQAVLSTPNGYLDIRASHASWNNGILIRRSNADTSKYANIGMASDTELFLGVQSATVGVRINTAGDLIIDGNLTVKGTNTTVNSTNLEVSDRVIKVNKTTGTVAVPALYTGFAVARGNDGTNDRTNVGVYWDEPNGRFVMAHAPADDSGTIGSKVNLAVLGLVADGVISGNGSGLTSLNASNISSGTIAGARLPYASAGTQGAVKVGDGLEIDGSGVLRVTNFTGAYTANGKFTVNVPAVSGSEVLAEFTVSDDAVGKLEIANASSAATRFLPSLTGTAGGSDTGVYIVGRSMTDTGTYPAVVIDGRINTSTALVTRPIAAFRNNGVAKVTVGSDGHITGAAGMELGGGITMPDANGYLINFTGQLDHGLYWDTLNNQFQMRAGTGVNRFSFDLDDGWLAASGGIGTPNINVTSGNGNGLRLWGSSSYSIYMSTAIDGVWGGRLEPTSDYNMYFKMASGTNRGFAFKHEDVILAHLTPSSMRLAKPLIMEAGKHVETESVQVKAPTSSKRFRLEYNEADDAIDFIFSAA